MNNKLINWIMGITFSLICLVWLSKLMVHMTDTQNFNVVQSLTGEVSIRRDAGYWFKFLPRVWTYPKASIEICSVNSKENDPFIIQFNNKSTAKLNCQVGYRLDGSTDEQLIALHQEVEGCDEKIWQMVYTRLNTELQKVATQFDPSDVVGGEKFPQFEAACSKAVLHNADLLTHGIDVNSFTIDGKPEPDAKTKEGLDKQRDADLARRKAIAEKEQLEAETIRTTANYAREIAEFKGKADAETAKLKTEAEREKELATIAAKKQVEVAKLEKEKAQIEVEKQKEVARIEAEKQLAVAEVQKKTEAEKLESIKLQAEQKIAEANAKKVAIELSGAITETERVKLEIEKETKIGVAEQLAKTYAHWNPQVIQVSGGNGNISAATSSLDNFLNTAAAKTALEMTVKPTVNK